MSVWTSAQMVGLCWRQADHGLSVPFLHKKPAVLTQHVVDYGPSCGSLLGLSQEWADSATTFQSYTSFSGYVAAARTGCLVQLRAIE